MVQGNCRYTDAYPFYSFSNETVSPDWLLGI